MPSSLFLSRGYLTTSWRRYPRLVTTNQLQHLHQRLQQPASCHVYTSASFCSAARKNTSGSTSGCFLISTNVKSSSLVQNDVIRLCLLRRVSSSSTASQKVQTDHDDAPSAPSTAAKATPSPFSATTFETAPSSPPITQTRCYEPLNPDPYYEKIDLTFSNTRECFRNKSTYELLRSIFVFQVTWLVSLSKSMFVGLSPSVGYAMTQTFTITKSDAL